MIAFETEALFSHENRMTQAEHFDFDQADRVHACFGRAFFDGRARDQFGVRYEPGAKFAPTPLVVTLKAARYFSLRALSVSSRRDVSSFPWVGVACRSVCRRHSKARNPIVCRRKYHA